MAVAQTAADQLRNVGIAATVLSLDPVVLYRDALKENRVDAIVGWHQAGGNLATVSALRARDSGRPAVALRCEGLGFSYPGGTRPVLHDLNLAAALEQ